MRGSMSSVLCRAETRGPSSSKIPRPKRKSGRRRSVAASSQSTDRIAQPALWLTGERVICYRPCEVRSSSGEHQLKTHLLWSTIAALLLSAAAAGDVWAQALDYPNKPVRMVIDSGGGSAKG